MTGPFAALFLALAPSVLPQDDPLRRPFPEGEGALQNDVFLPISERAAALLEKEGRALDAWRNALAESDASDSVPAPRGTESVDRAVIRRLREGGGELVSAWRERFEPSAENARLASLADPRLLARVERDWPMTRAAARAALGLADRALEEGNRAAAAVWLERAGAHPDPSDRALSDAIARRGSALGASLPAEAGAWTKLRLEARVPLESTARASEGIRLGLAFLEDGRICVQGLDTLHVVEEGGASRSFPLPMLVRGFGWSWIEPFVEERGAWILRPAARGRDLALVAGRAARTRGNALLMLDLSGRAGEPKLSWGYSDAGFRGEIAGPRPLAETLGPGMWEFEPGPLFVGDTLVAQLRQWTAEDDEPPTVDESAVRAWCFAFDAETGLPKWKTLLAIGPSAAVEIWGARGIARPADPLAELPGSLFASTGIGAGAFLDPLDGSPIRTVRNRRASAGAPRWRTGAAIAVDSTLIWTPSDSDRLYALRGDGDPLLPPAALESQLEAIGARGDRVLCLSEAGDRGVLSSLDLRSGARSSSVELPRGERLTGGGLVLGSRAVVASDRSVRLFDLTRDLYLLDAVSLEGEAAGIAARSDRVFVAGERMLWILRAR